MSEWFHRPRLPFKCQSGALWKKCELGENKHFGFNWCILDEFALAYLPEKFLPSLCLIDLVSLSGLLPYFRPCDALLRTVAFKFQIVTFRWIIEQLPREYHIVSNGKTNRPT